MHPSIASLWNLHIMYMQSKTIILKVWCTIIPSIKSLRGTNEREREAERERGVFVIPTDNLTAPKLASMLELLVNIELPKDLRAFLNDTCKI